MRGEVGRTCEEVEWWHVERGAAGWGGAGRAACVRGGTKGHRKGRVERDGVTESRGRGRKDGARGVERGTREAVRLGE